MNAHFPTDVHFSDLFNLLKAISIIQIMNHPMTLARGAFCVVPNESNHDIMSTSAPCEQSRDLIKDFDLDFVKVPPTQTLKLCNVTSSYLNSSATKVKQAFDKKEQSSSPRSLSSRSTKAADASPTSVTNLIDKKTAQHIPMLPNVTKSISASKRVRFQVNKNGEIDEDISIRSFPKHQLTAEDVKVCWYGRQERRQLKSDIPLECLDCRHSLPKYRGAALKVWVLASCEEYSSLLQTSLDALKIIVDGKARGLERPMFARMNLPRRSSKPNVREVLHMQKFLQEIKSGTYSYDDASALIAEQSRFNSQNAVRWAQILAEGDAIDAQE